MLKLFAAIVVALTVINVAAEAQDTDRAAVRRQVESLTAAFDSAAFMKSSSPAEMVVLAYQMAQGRPPNPEEFHTLLGLYVDLHMEPGDVLSFAIRGSDGEITWEMCQRFLARKTGIPAPSQETSRIAQALQATPPAPSLEEVLPKMAVAPPPPKNDAPGTVYNTYFGYLHAHSELSDGTGTPDEAYAGARDAGLDFFALTDHGELLRLWPWDDKWDRQKGAADRADAPGEFAALCGFEWSSPLYGHVTVVNTEDFTDCVTAFRLSAFYEWLQARPEGFGRFNHPGCFDYAVLDLLHFRLFPGAVAQMVGVEVWNEDDGFDSYHYGGNWNGPETYLDAANLQGWRLGPLGGEDNHRADWGRMGEFRTAVLATELTRESITQAYLGRRFYATEDGDLCLDVRCGGYPMGSVLDGEQRVLEVTAYDRGGDEFEQVRLYRNGELLETRQVQGPEVFEVFHDDSTDAAYYHVMVRQTDDSDANGRNDEAISSPIWFGTVNQMKSSGCFSPPEANTPATAGAGTLTVLAIAVAAMVGTRKRFR